MMKRRVIVIALLLANADGCNQDVDPSSPRAALIAPASVAPMAAKTKPLRVYVANTLGAYVTEYSSEDTELISTIRAEKSTSLAFDARNHLYVSQRGNVSEYEPGKRAPIRVFHGFGNDPIAVDRSGKLYIGRANTVYVFGHHGIAPINTISNGVEFAIALAFDQRDNLYVANYSSMYPSVTVYAPGGGDPIRTITQDIAAPVALALDKEQNLYVAGQDDVVTVYAAGSTNLLRSLTDMYVPPTCNSLAVDRSDRLYVANDDSQTGEVDVFEPQSTNIARKITTGVSGPFGIALDRYDRLYVANAGNSTVTVYGANSGDVLETYSKDIASPGAIAISP